MSPFHYALFAAILLSCACLCAQDARPTTAPTTRPLSGPLGKPIQLFNGKNLDGWVWYQRPPKPGATQPTTQVSIGEVWTVRDGILHTSGKPTGYIRTETVYDNYILTVE